MSEDPLRYEAATLHCVANAHEYVTPVQTQTIQQCADMMTPWQAIRTQQQLTANRDLSNDASVRNAAESQHLSANE